MLKIGIVGLPNVGKSTLFKALTKKSVDIANYPFCTIDPNVGIVEVLDERLDKLSEKFNSKKKIPAVIEFVDIAGLVKGASKGQGLGNKFLSHIREVDAIVQIARVFEGKDIIHVDGNIDPLRDIEVINTELILADLETIEKYSEKLGKEMRQQNKEAMREKEILDKIKKHLDQGKLANDCEISFEDKKSIKNLNLLTLKPFLYVYNFSGENFIVPEELKNKKYIPIDVKIEEDIMNMTAEEVSDFGINSNLNNLIKASFELLDLIVFFTTGEDESRAWEIKRGTTAQKAGGAIHSDFENNFIRAEIILWDKLLEIGSWPKARELGLIKSEGKEYIVKDGDVVNFLI
ncbi:MAG: redox-regulated ATPase YchF [bacterium]|nr:redox-regulated ATPase YchF [bacterium]